MIRNVVLGRLRAGVDPVAVEPALAAIVALRPEGLLDCRVGRDLRLRDESWDFAITSDFTDEQTYRAYDREPSTTACARRCSGRCAPRSLGCYSRRDRRGAASCAAAPVGAVAWHDRGGVGGQPRDA